MMFTFTTPSLSVLLLCTAVQPSCVSKATAVAFLQRKTPRKEPNAVDFAPTKWSDANAARLFFFSTV